MWTKNLWWRFILIYTICSRSIITTPKYFWHEDSVLFFWFMQPRTDGRQTRNWCVHLLSLTSMAVVIFCSAISCIKAANPHFCNCSIHNIVFQWNLCSHGNLCNFVTLAPGVTALRSLPPVTGRARVSPPGAARALPRSHARYQGPRRASQLTTKHNARLSPLPQKLSESLWDFLAAILSSAPFNLANLGMQFVSVLSFCI